MRIQVSLYSTQKEKRLTDAFMEMHEKGTIRDLLPLLDIGIEDVAIIIVNGKSSTYKQMLKEGDRITLIPPLAGG
jgi:sulfur carrier protein ThiS